MRRGSLLIKGGRIVDPGQGIDMVGNLFVANGVIAWMREDIPSAWEKADTIVLAGGMVVSPGFVDLHCHLREPGFEEKETIATGAQAAARGGYTTVCCMPNTSPPIDSPETVAYILDKAKSNGAVRVFPVACISKGRRGEELVEMGDLAKAGVVAFSDDGASVASSHLMRRALEYSCRLKLPITDHCEDSAMTEGGAMNEGKVAVSLGLKGMPAAAEESIVARDIDLARLTSARLHIAHVSTAGSVELIRCAKEEGVKVTAEVTPHHLTLTEERVGHYDTNAKVNPPLRSEKDTEALLQGLKDGVIDAVATDHAPHTAREKACQFDLAAFGISGLETALGVLLSLVHRGKLDLVTLVSKLTVEPSRILDFPWGLGTLKVGAPADLVIFDPYWEWVVDTAHFASKGKNNPWAGCVLRGKAMVTVVGGEIVHRDNAVRIEGNGE